MEKREVIQMWWCTAPLKKKFPHCGTHHPKISLQNTVSVLPEDIYRGVGTLQFCVVVLQCFGGSQDTHKVFKYWNVPSVLGHVGYRVILKGLKDVKVFFFCVWKYVGVVICSVPFLFSEGNIFLNTVFLLLNSCFREQGHRVCYFIFQIRQQNNFVVIKK